MEITRDPTDCFFGVIYIFYFHRETFVGSQRPTGDHCIFKNEKTLVLNQGTWEKVLCWLTLLNPRPQSVDHCLMCSLQLILNYIFCRPRFSMCSLQLTAPSVRDLRTFLHLCILSPPAECPPYALPVFLLTASLLPMAAAHLLPRLGCDILRAESDHFLSACAEEGVLNRVGR